MDIEQLATSAVIDSLARTKYLRSYINAGDKEPSWDGNIYVYDHISCCNANLKGRCPVQVKGKEAKSITKDKISYPVKIVDINNYLYDGGIIYFVVYLTRDNKKIYYSSLLPYDIKEIMKKAGKQKTISIHLKEFPDDEIEKTDLFLNFIKDRAQQRILLTLSDEDIKSIEAKEDKKYSFSLTTSDKNIDYTHEQLFDKEFYLYIEADFGIKIPIKKANGIDAFRSRKESPVYCGETKYYDSYRIVRENDSTEFCFGEGITFILNKKSNKTQINYQNKGTLNQQIVDLTFYIDLFESQSVKFGEDIITIKREIDDTKSADIKEMQDKLLYFQNIQIALEAAGNKKELDIMSLKQEEWKNVNILLKAFIDNQSISLNFTKEAHLLRLKIGNIGIILFSHKEVDGTYRLLNVFKEKMVVNHNSENGEIVELCLFCFFSKNDFLEASNIDYEAIYLGLTNIPGNKTYYNYVNNLILQMLLAYDAGDVKDNELLDYTIRLAKWLHAQTNGIIELLNYLQAEKRLRPLIKIELDKLHDLIEHHSKSNPAYNHALTLDELADLYNYEPIIKTSLLIGGYILLEDFPGATLHYSNLPAEKQEEFVQYPIYNLWVKAKPVSKE